MISYEEFGLKDVGFDFVEDLKKVIIYEVRDELVELEEDLLYFGMYVYLY